MDRFCSKIVSFYCQSLSLAWTNTITWTKTLAYYRIRKLQICNVLQYRHQESISSTNFINAQRHLCKVNVEKIMFCSTNICAKILQHILGFSFLCRAPYFGTILPNAVAVKSRKNCLRKSCSALAPKMLVKLTIVLCLKVGNQNCSNVPNAASY